MKKISEMTLEELQDYALEQDNKIKTLTTNIEGLTAENTEIKGYNLELQKRNNKLFTQLEQQDIVAQKEDPKKEVTTCEDFARNLIK